MNKDYKPIFEYIKNQTIYKKSLSTKLYYRGGVYTLVLRFHPNIKLVFENQNLEKLKTDLTNMLYMLKNDN